MVQKPFTKENVAKVLAPAKPDTIIIDQWPCKASVGQARGGALYVKSQGGRKYGIRSKSVEILGPLVASNGSQHEYMIQVHQGDQDGPDLHKDRLQRHAAPNAAKLTSVVAPLASASTAAVSMSVPGRVTENATNVAMQQQTAVAGPPSPALLLVLPLPLSFVVFQSSQPTLI